MNISEMTEEDKEHYWPSTYENLVKKMESYPIKHSGNIWNEDGDVVLYTRYPTRKFALEFIENLHRELGEGWTNPHVTLSEDGDYCMEWDGPGKDFYRSLTIYMNSGGRIYYIAIDRDNMMYDNEFHICSLGEAVDQYRWMREEK